MKKKTRLEALIEHRNNIYLRKVGLEIDEKFFTRENLITKGNEHLEIEKKLNNIKSAINGHNNILKVIDEMIKEAK
mgnify:CR=1 FL=1